jgi:hypothetical protein
VGPFDHWGLRVGHWGPDLVQIWGTHSGFELAGFSGLKKMISRNYEKASKIYILRFIAPNLMKPILAEFLGVDLQHKNIVWQI